VVVELHHQLIVNQITPWAVEHVQQGMQVMGWGTMEVSLIEADYDGMDGSMSDDEMRVTKARTV